MSASPGRVVGVDAARGLAALAMIQGHAFDAATAPASRTGLAWAIESQLQTLALPAFLLLAGASLALRLRAAEARGERAEDVRRAITKRGLSLVLVGYGLSAFSALVDGWESADTFFRADVLHVIGLSLSLLSLGVRGDGSGRVCEAAAVPYALFLVSVPLLSCPLLSPLGGSVEGPARYVVGLVVDVPGITRMPLVPLVAWAAGGFLLARVVVSGERPAGAPLARAVLLVALALGAALTLTLAQDLVVGEGTLTRAHPGVIPNALQLFARGVLVLAAGMLIVEHLPEPAARALLRLGRGSLVAYAFHVPLCYGRLASPITEQLSMPLAALFAVTLWALSYLAVLARDAIKGRATRSPRSA